MHDQNLLHGTCQYPPSYKLQRWLPPSTAQTRAPGPRAPPPPRAAARWPPWARARRRWTCPPRSHWRLRGRGEGDRREARRVWATSSPAPPGGATGGQALHAFRQRHPPPRPTPARPHAPAPAAAAMFWGASPPSTWMASAGCARRSAATLAIMAGMNDWPPKPGSTVMTSTRSTAPASGNTASTGVPGLSATPTRMPRARMRSISPAASSAGSGAAAAGGGGARGVGGWPPPLRARAR